MRETNCILIAGLPGSGKTYLGNNLSSEKGFSFVDDPSTKPNALVLFKELVKHPFFKGIVIADTFFCLKEKREYAIDYMKSLGLNVECIYFENNLQKCLANIEKRGKEGDARFVMPTMKLMSQHYHIPEDAVVKVIWQEN